MINVFSRYTVGTEVLKDESGDDAAELYTTAFTAQHLQWRPYRRTYYFTFR